MTLLQELQDDLDGPWTLEAMAARAGYDPFHLTRGFQAVVGQPPLRYLRTLRLERAAHDLVFAPERRLIDIGVAAGYTSSEAFRRAFVRSFGVPPSAMRQRPRGPRGPSPRPCPADLPRPAGLLADPTIVRLGPLASQATVLAARFDAPAIADAWRTLARLDPPDAAWRPAAATAPWGFTAPGRPREYRCIHLGAARRRAGRAAGLSPWSMRPGWFARFAHEGPTPAIDALMAWIFRAWLPASRLRWRFAPVITSFAPEVWRASSYQRSRCEVHVPVTSLGDADE